MGALLYTITFILLLTTLTYSSLSHFKTTSFRTIALSQHYRDHQAKIHNDEIKKYRADRQNKINNKIKQNNLTEEKEAKKDEGESSAVGMMSVHIFLHKERTIYYNEYKNVFKSLMEILYSHESFYQELKDKRPYILDDLLDSFIRDDHVYSLSKNSDLARINFDDPDINEFTTKIFKQSQRYENFLDYFTIKNQTTIGLKTAPEKLLVAIFNNFSAAKEISLKIEELKHAVTEKQLSREEAKIQLQNFIEQFSSLLPKEALDCTINPSCV